MREDQLNLLVDLFFEQHAQDDPIPKNDVFFGGPAPSTSGSNLGRLHQGLSTESSFSFD